MINLMKKIMVGIKKIRWLFTLKPWYKNMKNALGNGVFVYQMGKVGSTSIVDSIINSGIPVVHFHRLNKNNSCYNINEDSYQNQKKTKYPYWDISTKRKLILKELRRHKIKVITIVREPIAQTISTFFEDLDHNIFLFAKDLCNKNKEAVNILEEYQNKTLYGIYNYTMNKDYCSEYFDKEFLINLNIDVYEHKFDKEAGYSVVSTADAEILIIKFEMLKKYEKVISDFLGVQGFLLSDRNITNEKWCSNIYSEFKNHYKLDQGKLDTIYATKYCRHFYTQEELESFKKKWMKNIEEL